MNDRTLSPDWYAQWIRDHYQDHPTVDGLCRAMTAAALAAQPQGEPVAYTTGIVWHPNPSSQSEQAIKITRQPQPDCGRTVPIYAAPPARVPQSEPVALPPLPPLEGDDPLGLIDAIQEYAVEYARAALAAAGVTVTNDGRANG